MLLPLLLVCTLNAPATECEPFSPEPLIFDYPDTPISLAESRLVNTHPPQPEPEAETYAFSGMGDNVEQWRPLVAGHFEPGDVNRVLCLMSKESGGNPTAKSHAGARGLMQIMPFWAGDIGVSVSDLYKPEINLFAARHVKDQQGWGAWDPYRRGECR